MLIEVSTRRSGSCGRRRSRTPQHQPSRRRRAESDPGAEGNEGARRCNALRKCVAPAPGCTCTRASSKCASAARRSTCRSPAGSRSCRAICQIAFAVIASGSVHSAPLQQTASEAISCSDHAETASSQTALLAVTPAPALRGFPSRPRRPRYGFPRARLRAIIARARFHRELPSLPTQSGKTLFSPHYLETRVAELVDAAYGPTPDKVDLLWRTAPPRMPIAAKQAR
jgi:hypothetical protein